MPVQFQKYLRDTKQWVTVIRRGETWQDESGEMVELFRIRIFAEALDRKVEQIKEWEKTGKLPKPLFSPEGEQCKHWYSATQIINCHRLMMHKYQGKKYLSNKELFLQFIDDIKGIWHAKNVVVSEKGEVRS